MGVHTTRRYCSNSKAAASTKREMKRRQYNNYEAGTEDESSASATYNASDADDVAGDIANIPNAKCDATEDTGGGGGGCGEDESKSWWMYKAKRHIGKSAQSVLQSLAASVLIVNLFNFWNWLASRLKKSFGLPPQIKSNSTTFCANSHPHHSYLPTTLTREEEKEVNFQLKFPDSPPANTEAKMTIEVSDIITAIVNPGEEEFDQQQQDIMEEESLQIRMKNHHLSAASALPVLRLNSESFEDNLSSSEGDLMFEEDDGASSSSSENNHSEDGGGGGGGGGGDGRRDQDSCSDYCSGSGSLSGSPVPDHHHNLIERHHHRDGILESVVNSSQLIRRDSDSTSDSSVNEDDERRNSSNKAGGGVNADNNKASSGEVGPELKAKIISQVESMFSDEHLEKDGFLLKHVRRRSDGFVSLKLVAGLRKVKQLSREFSVVLVALKESDKLEVNSEGTKIRRKEPLTSLLKSLPIKQAKKEKSQAEKENQSSNGNNSSADEQQNVTIIRSSNQANRENGKNGMKNQRNGASPAVYNINGGITNNNRKNSNQQQYPNTKASASRKSSNASTASSNVNSRNGSFSSGTGRPHPADMFRHMMTTTSAGSSGEDSPQVIRRRGGSLPINTGHRGSIGGHNNLSPNSSPPSNVPAGFLRPKSNSYCEGTTNQQATTGMSPWLLKRKASAVSRSSNGDIVISGVIRQPRGPDGTKGFASGYRELILQDRLTSVSECSTFFA